MRNPIAITTIGGCALLLGACTTDLQKMDTAQAPAGTDFTRALSADYRGLATRQWTDQVDFTGSEHFARKAMASGRGETVAPDAIAAYGPPVRLQPEIVAARARLITALQGDAPARVPAAAARAQVSFDCWLDETADPIMAVEGTWLQSKVQNCRSDFETAMNAVDARGPVAAAPTVTAPSGAPAAPRQLSYLTFFDYDRSVVSAEALAVIRAAGDNIRRGGVSRITVTGNTDSSGTEVYNQALSQRRADAVRAVLVREGVPANQIVTVARGETQPLVSVAPGAREPQNRNAAIILQ
jgi:outer membrane protein OmpA-like peptidoglycan-associated protein